jgi:acyl transferase domain-containing protein
VQCIDYLQDWLDLRAKDGQDAGLYRIAGGHDFALSNRISYEYNLKGPSFTIKSACSSSMIALHEAFRAIQSGDCSAAIVAGTNLILSPTVSIAMTEQGVLSPDGKCKSFDISANGFARGEAINAIYIKRLSDAIEDNDPIRAIIRSTASNCDGKTAGLAMPSSESHEAVMRKAYKEADLEPTQTAFVEAHGTGTYVGDPLEANAIARIFGSEKGVYIGSVKPNLGHSEGASGISSIMKAVLALENKTIPPNINFSTPNPKIPFQAANMAVPLESLPWPKSHALRASVNSFGIGGANAHVILESASSFGLGGPKSVQTARSTNGNGNGHMMDRNGNENPKREKFLLVLSAANSYSLKESLLEHQQYIEENVFRMKDISYTLCNRREHLSTRVFCVTDESAALPFSSIAKTRKTPQVTMVFTGQGAQWAGMAKALMEDYRSFNDDIDSLSAVLSKLEPAPSWDMKEELVKSDSQSNLGKAEYAQPLVTAIQVALINLLRACGILPAAVLGHSSGEIAAAYAAQAITSEEAIMIAYYRGQVTKGYTRPGGMVAVGLGCDQVGPYLVPGVVIGCENSPRSVTLSGDKSALEEVCKNIETDMPDVFLRRLKVEMAYHSRTFPRPSNPK